MKILVTGGAGFIGSHTADGLLRAGHLVRILDNLSEPVHLPDVQPYIPENTEFVKGDVTSRQDMRAALSGIDAVYHFAAYQDYLLDFSTFFHVNAVGTALLYEIIVADNLPVQKIVLASSQAVYGEGRYCCAVHGVTYPPMRDISDLEKGQWGIRCGRCGNAMIPEATDESVVNPQTQYAMAKYTEEMIGLNLGRRWGIPTVALRYSIVQGPRQSFHNAYSGACRVFCLSYHFGKTPVIYEDGQQFRDFVNIEDVVRANLVALDHPKADFQVFNVGGGKPYSVSEFAEIVARAAKSESPARVTGEFRFGDTRHIISNLSRIETIGWKPLYSPEKSVTDYLQWLTSQSALEDALAAADRTMRTAGVVRPAKAALVSPAVQ